MVLSLGRSQKTATSGCPTCAVCNRFLLVGESVSIWRAKGDQMSRICELCEETARRNGWEPLASGERPRLRVRPGGTLGDGSGRDALLKGLGEELSWLKEQLGAAQHALGEQEQLETVVQSVTDQLCEQQRELEMLRREANPHERIQNEQKIAEQANQIKHLENMVRNLKTDNQRLSFARNAEASTTRMCGFALEAFNSHKSFEKMLCIARTLGEPEAWAIDLGPAIPRVITLQLIWDISWHEFAVRIDLGRGKASVTEKKSGGDPEVPNRNRTKDPLLCNHQIRKVSWRQSGLVLT